MMLLGRIRAAWRLYKSRRFLAKHLCDSWKEYNRNFDKRIRWSASTLPSFYHGYKSYHVITNHKHEAYFWDIGVDGVYVLDKWCEANLTGHYRLDWHRMSKKDEEWRRDDGWQIDELGGGDYIVVAFTNDIDNTLFALRWL